MSRNKKLLQMLRSSGNYAALGRQLYADADTCKRNTLHKRVVRYLKRAGVAVPEAMRRAGRRPIPVKLQPEIKKEGKGKC